MNSRMISLAAIAVLGLLGTTAFAQRPVVLTLGDAARLAARQNALAEAALIQVEQTTARAQQQRAELLPAVSGSVSNGQRTLNTAAFGISFPDAATGAPLFPADGQVLGPTRTMDLRASARWTLADLAAIERMRAGRAGVAAASELAAEISQQAAASAANAYIGVLRTDAHVAARLADSVLTADLLHIARMQREAGMGITLDVTRALTQSAAARAELIAARSARERAQLALLRALGLPLGTPVRLADSLGTGMDSQNAPSEGQATELALKSRADLRALDAQAAAASRQLTAIKLERLPAVTLVADKGATGNSSGYLLNTYSWGIQVSLPLFDGLRREARIGEQRSALRELAVRRRDQAQQMAIEVRTALLDLASAREQLAACDERLSLAQDEVAQARDRFVQGVAGNADVISALATLNAARTQQVDARAAVQLARVALARATGTIAELP